MGWASNYIADLQTGKTVSFRPRGNSMVPKINSGDLCTVKPYTSTHVLAKGDIVLCKVNGTQYLHLVTGVRSNQVQISNNKGHVNGWTSLSNIYGVLTSVVP